MPLAPLRQNTAKGYQIDAAIIQKVLQATDAQEIPGEERKRLYSALNREIMKPEIPAGVLARWSSDRKSHKTALFFLKEWVQDTSFASVEVTEHHIRMQENYKETLYMWMTKIELYSGLGAFHSPEAKAYADKIMLHAPQQKSRVAAHRNDTDFNSFKVWDPKRDQLRRHSE